MKTLQIRRSISHEYSQIINFYTYNNSFHFILYLKHFTERSQLNLIIISSNDYHR